MDIDGRLEALTQTVELIASFQKEMFQRMDVRDAHAAEREARADEREARADKREARADARMARLEKVLAAVGSTVLEHEDRIAGLEKRLA